MQDQLSAKPNFSFVSELLRNPAIFKCNLKTHNAKGMQENIALKYAIPSYLGMENTTFSDFHFKSGVDTITIHEAYFNTLPQKITMM